jgi:murein DD-endopeptidase MepM/ murein hydrolase activator NlpD
MRPSQRITILALMALLAACVPAPLVTPPVASATPTLETGGPTPLPVRTPHPPGEIFEYTAQQGDTLPAIAAHFHSSEREIRAANPDLPAGVTTLPAGYPLRVPAYYLPLTGSPFHILPDSEVVNGLGAIGFDTQSEIASRPGFLAGMSDYANRHQRPAWEVVDIVATEYSIHPRLLLALLEAGTGALTRADPSSEDDLTFPLGYHNDRYRGLYRQLLWAAETLNNGYYGWRTGTLAEWELADGRLVRPDPWLNAGTAALHALLAVRFGQVDFDRQTSPDGFQQTYRQLWGDPFAQDIEFIPGNLQQAELALPFLPNRLWDFTGGPHESWGTALPLGALDFAPPAMEGGCAASGEWIAAPAAGIVTRSEEGIVVLDLGDDGDERTGWALLFFHVGTDGRVGAGTALEQGGQIGHPSCEGGRSTGTHFHIARKYNGEWIPAYGPLAFILDGWVAAYGGQPYQGTLTKGSKTVAASTTSTAANRILYTLPGQESAPPSN